ncbi:MAG TPA: oxidoreductase-like domain-containing protein [Burkholderiales bacterium]|nr:oxidoreductase-like domain-containing protein [Burkholderiales bacterium]
MSEARAVVSTLRAKAFARQAVIPPPPDEPLASDCCERGCERCVFTVYYEALELWRRDIERAWSKE